MESKVPIKVLVSSLSRDFGGVESLFLSLSSGQTDEMKFDYICSDIKAAREDGFSTFGSTVYHVPRSGKSLLKYIKAIFKIMKSGEYQLYHVNLTRRRQPIDLIIAKLCGLKVVLHCHSTKIYSAKSKKQNIVRKVQQKVFAPIYRICSDLNLACSKTAGEYLFHGMNYEVIYNGIDISKYEFSLENRQQVRGDLSLTGKTVVGHIGRFSSEKNHLFLLKIIKNSLKSNPDIHLLSIGSGDLFEPIKEYAKELNIEDNITFLGERHDISKLLSAMDIFVFPSVHEALPITLIEAQANGVPCLVSDCVTNEVKVKDNFSYLSPDNVCEWSEKMNSVLAQDSRNPDLLPLDKFNINKMKKHLCELYNTVLQNGEK